MKMKIKLSKLTALILTLVMFVSLIPLNVFAEEHQTGCEPDDPELIQQLLAISENCLNLYGDLDKSGVVTITDAKLALKDIVNDVYDVDADVNKDGRVSILDARQILRVIVKLDTFKVKAELKVGEVYETGTAYDKEPCKWTCNISPKVGLIGIKKYSYPSTPPLYEYNFTATVPGEYEAVLKYENSTTHEVFREVTYNFVVK